MRKQTDLLAADISLAAGLVLGTAATWLFFSTRRLEVAAHSSPVDISIGWDLAGQRRVEWVWSTPLR